MLEIHPVDAGDHRRHRDHGRPRRELLRHLALGQRNHAEIDLDGGGEHVADALDRRVDAVQVIVDVAEVLLHPRAHLRDPAAIELAGGFHQRVDRMLQHHQLLLQRVKRLDVRPRRVAHEDLLLDLLQLRLHAVQDREIAVDDGVHQRVEHEARSVAAAARARARSARGRRRSPSASDGARRGCSWGRRRCRPRRRSAPRPPRRGDGSSVCRTTNSESSYSSIFGRWWPLRASSTASGCRSNSAAISSISSCRRLEQRDPDEALGPRHVIADVGHRNVAELLPVLVGDAID